MDRESFISLVAGAVRNLPEEFATRLNNIVIVVEDRPIKRQLVMARLERGQTLLGLYEGIPQTKRGRHYGLVPPDIITIFQRPIEAICRDNTEVIIEIDKVVEHEIAHHFGIDDARLRQIHKRKVDQI